MRCLPKTVSRELRTGSNSKKIYNLLNQNPTLTKKCWTPTTSDNSRKMETILDFCSFMNNTVTTTKIYENFTILLKEKTWPSTEFRCSTVSSTASETDEYKYRKRLWKRTRLWCTSHRSSHSLECTWSKGH